MEGRWIAAVRVIPDAVKRARWRNTLQFRFLPTLSAGVELNLLSEKEIANPLANWLAVTETKTRPALIFGTSSDRIGTPTGQSFFGTLSKDLKSHTGIPIAPYAGVTYGTYEDKWRPIGGVNIRFPHNFSSLIIFDGVKLHPTAGWSYRNFTFTFLLAAGQDPGLAASVAF
ncbi:MAG: hypothetical protein L0196_07690 [candidate division Zixibacteria bacterium]|nr:hypothetical protein [candidate division Zixibacteria bacterium]